MFKLLSSLFIKNKDDVHQPKVRTAYGILSSVIGILSNTLLAILKITTGILVGSISILADGINNLSDSASSTATLIGFHLANQPADPEHPFGHERIEYITGVVISIFILVVGILLGKSSIERIISKEKVDISQFILLVVILGISILVKIWQGLFYRKCAKKINSLTLIATSQDSFNDAIATTAVFISILVFYFFQVNLDGWFGLGVSIFIVINGIKLMKETISPLIGEAPSKEFTQFITDKVKSYEGILGVHDLVIHSYGPAKTFVTLHVEVDSRESILESHDKIDKIERDFKRLGYMVTIHMDPVEVADERTNTLKQLVKDELSKIHPQLQFHDFRVIHTNLSTTILFDLVKPQQVKLTDEELSEEVIERIKKICENHLMQPVDFIINIDQDYVL